ncbi:MAG: aminopeptidase P N-terminal domain-containing protein [Burkholderiaceae bacterium]
MLSATHAPADLYAQRRARVAAALAAASPHAVALIPTAPERARNRDSDFLYRHDSYFYYLTGFAEPGAFLVIDSRGQSTLFCQPKDPEREIWDGLRLGVEAAPAALGVDAAYPITELDTQLPRLLENCQQVAFPFATHAGLEAQVAQWLGKVRARARYGVLCPEQQTDLCALLDEMRLFKDAHEQDVMRRAAHISAQAHIRAMQTCAKYVRVPPPGGLREFHLDAELLHEFRRHGSQCPAYGSIVAAGANACVLHYRADAAPVRAGELVLIDAGCELDGYASDITRTFPANGTFTAPQRALYGIVLAAQEAAAAATKPGAKFTEPHDAAVAVLAQGLLDVGLLDKNKVGSLQDVIEKRAYFPFYMHRTGHWLGMDVHDCGSYIEPPYGQPTNEPGVQGEVTERTDPLSGEVIQNRPSRILRPGMVLTIEPGLYVRPAEGVPEAFWNIGIRIEDDAIVTASGCELISRGVPVQPDEIEALMREGASV